jgi:hypothetical protein
VDSHAYAVDGSYVTKTLLSNYESNSGSELSAKVITITPERFAGGIKWSESLYSAFSITYPARENIDPDRAT